MKQVLFSEGRVNQFLRVQPKKGFNQWPQFFSLRCHKNKCLITSTAILAFIKFSFFLSLFLILFSFPIFLYFSWFLKWQPSRDFIVQIRSCWHNHHTPLLILKNMYRLQVNLLIFKTNFHVPYFKKLFYWMQHSIIYRWFSIHSCFSLRLSSQNEEALDNWQLTSEKLINNSGLPAWAGRGTHEESFSFPRHHHTTYKHKKPPLEHHTTARPNPNPDSQIHSILKIQFVILLEGLCC